ncbi:MAG: 7-cyano-7-deazaguanine synthase, partial [Bacillota bacterium]
MTLEDFFHDNNHVALGFSGGVDSSYLLYSALKSGAQVRAYYARSAFQPLFELEDATRLAQQLQADLKILDVDVLSDAAITANPVDRCYHCKKRIFSAIAAQALADGYHTLIDGTNASDDAGDRPGMRALTEMSVCSPLRECGLTKDEIRRLS